MTDVASAHAREQSRIAVSAAREAAVRWNRANVDSLVDSWEELLPSTVEMVTAAQLRAAYTGAAYTPAVVREQGAVPAQSGTVRPEALAGVASDGRPLDTLLTVPATTTLDWIGRGTAPDMAYSQGRRHTMMLVATQVLDAGRVAASIGMVTERKVFGYRRQLRGATDCARCVVLAGKWFGWNEGFQRHPGCDCVHVPHTGSKGDVAGLEGFDPKARFDSFGPVEQDRVFTKAGARAIRDGADMNQVVNARRGMRTTVAYGRKVRTTTVGTTARMSSARRAAEAAGDTSRRRRLRLMPEQIYADARDRDHAVELLRRFGFI